MSTETYELRVRLAEKLGWKWDLRNSETYWFHPNAIPSLDFNGNSFPSGPPDLASLVRQAEQGLSEEQQIRYAGKVAGELPEAQFNSKAFWFYLITASYEDRAKALLEVL